MAVLVHLGEKVFCNCVGGHGGSVPVMIFYLVKSGVKDRIVISLTDRSTRIVFEAFGNTSKLWFLTVAV
jgi:protein-tyrosine phosphatase